MIQIVYYGCEKPRRWALFCLSCDARLDRSEYMSNHLLRFLPTAFLVSPFSVSFNTVLLCIYVFSLPLSLPLSLVLWANTWAAFNLLLGLFFVLSMAESCLSNQVVCGLSVLSPGFPVHSRLSHPARLLRTPRTYGCRFLSLAITDGLFRALGRAHQPS